MSCVIMPELTESKKIGIKRKKGMSTTVHQVLQQNTVSEITAPEREKANIQCFIFTCVCVC